MALSVSFMQDADGSSDEESSEEDRRYVNQESRGVSRLGFSEV